MVRTSQGDEEDPELERVLLHDGGYYYVLPGDLKTEQVMVDGPTIWRYDGQQVFHIRDEPVSREVEYVVPEYTLTDVSWDAEAYLGVGKTTRVDRYGRRWLLIGIDKPALWEKLDAYDALVEQEFGVEPGAQERVGIIYNQNAGEKTSGTLTAGDVWSLDDCGISTGYEVIDHLYGGLTEPLTDVTTPEHFETKVVLVLGVTPDGYQYRGSGAMVDDDTVLTAAHVIADESGYFNPNLMRICSLGNVYASAVCHKVEDVQAPGGVWDDTLEKSWQYDYGVISLASPMPSSVGWLPMSVASDTVLEDSIHFHVGFPRYKPGSCSSNISSSSTDIINSGSYTGRDPVTGMPQPYKYYGSWLMTAYGPTYEVAATRIKFNVSSASQMSGSPYVYCPLGCSEGGDYITAVTSGNDSSPPIFTYGPKMRLIRDWVISFM